MNYSLETYAHYHTWVLRMMMMMMIIVGMRENDDDDDSDENEVNCCWCKNVFPQWTVELLRYLHFCFERKSRFAKYSICASPPLHERFGRFCKMIFKPNISICQTSGCLILRGRNIWNYRFTRLKLGSASIDTPNFLWIPRWWISRKSFHNLTTPRQLHLQKKYATKSKGNVVPWLFTDSKQNDLHRNCSTVYQQLSQLPITNFNAKVIICFKPTMSRW